MYRKLPATVFHELSYETGLVVLVSHKIPFSASNIHTSRTFWQFDLLVFFLSSLYSSFSRDHSVHCCSFQEIILEGFY